MSKEGKMDGFTAKVMLDAVKSGGGGDMAELYKGLTSHEGGPTPEEVTLVTSWIGKPCKIKYTTYTGVVKGVNTSAYGFYNGGRFPVIVSVDKTCDGSVHQTFEYGIDQIEIIDTSSRLEPIGGIEHFKP